MRDQKRDFRGVLIMDGISDARGTRSNSAPGISVWIGLAGALACIALLTQPATGVAQSGGPASMPSDALSPTVDPEIWPRLKWPLPTDAAIESRVQQLLKRMTLEEKVGQVLQADIASVTPEDVRKYHLGSVLNGGNSAPGGDEFAPPEKWLALADEFYAASVDTAGGRTAIPVLWGTDAVHGHSNIVGATLFPHNVGLGAMRNPALMERIAAATAMEVRVTGMEWTFAPTVAVPQDLRWGRAYEGYSEDPALVASYTGAFVRGLQGEPGSPDFLRPPHVLATTKHFLADGGTHEGRDQGDARIPETTLRDVHAAGYPPAIEAGVQTVMASFSSWNGVKITGHRGLLTDVLKGRMSFGGFIVTDWNAHSQIPGCTRHSCPQALNAGIDMYMAPDTWRGLYDSLLEQVRKGVIPQERLDDAVSRILRVKLRMGLFEAGPPSRRPFAGRFDLLGHPEHRALAREAVRQSLVLLKNEGELLPLKPQLRVLVAGDGADDIAKQSGGWTLTWQGTGVNNSHFPGATSIWGGIRSAVTAAGGTAELSIDGRFRERPDVAIVVFGENPYAEFRGDLTYLKLPAGNETHLATMRRLREQKIPVVAIFLSGRPLWMNRELNLANAFVAAWLPGSEGAGIADVLFRKPDGSMAHDFEGRLPFSWPRRATVQAAAGNTARDNVLFPVGYGLRYGSAGSFPRLSEDPGPIVDSRQAGVFFADASVVAPWVLSHAAEPGAVQPAGALPATLAAGRIRASRVDHTAQEDSLRFEWLGQGPGEIRFDSRDPFDFTREANGDVALVLNVRIDRPPSAPLEAFMGCGPGCGGALRIDDALRAAPSGQWRRLAIPLKCFERAGADLARVSTGLGLRTSGTASLALSRAALGTEADQTLSCAE